MTLRPLLTTKRIAHHTRRGEWPVPSVSALLDHRVRLTPDRLFLIDRDERLTFGQFAARVDRIAAGLHALAITAGDVVSWQLPNWWEAAALAVAVDRVGAINNPILPIYREREVLFVTEQARSRVLVVPGRFRGFDFRDLAAAVRGRASLLEHVVVVRDEPGAHMLPLQRLLEQDPSTLPAPHDDPHRVAYLFYTSGTTADPKGVLHTASTLGTFARINARTARTGSNDVALLQFPFPHIGGIGAFLLAPILLGSRVVFMDRWTAEEALRLIEAEHVTSAGGPPLILQGILASPELRPERVKTLQIVASGAAEISPELIRRVRARLAPASFRSYGLTECPMLTSSSVKDAERICAETDGRPTLGCAVRIVDDDGRVLPPGREGEIEAFGPQLCVGYVDPSLNKAAFTQDGFLRTGDLAVIDASGAVRVTGRKKDIIIRKGENLSAKEIEDILSEHPAVADVAVVGVPDAASGERACACVVLRAGYNLSLADIAHFMEARRVMRQKIPEQLEIVASLPRNAMGKVLKHELRQRFQSRA